MNASRQATTVSELFQQTITSLAIETESLHKLCILRKGMEASPASTMKSLRDIYKTVTSLEQQVQTLEEVVQEEVQAVENLERLKDLVLEQGNELRVVQDQLNQSRVILPGDGATPRNIVGSGRNIIRDKDHSQDSVMAGRKFSNNDENLDQFYPDGVNKENEGRSKQIVVPLLTESEFRALPRSIRGRLSLIAVNEAASEIQYAVRKKYNALERGSKRSNYQGTSFNHEYRQALILHRELEVDEHEGSPWISEQDLRDSCNFFRTGESSARVVLTILRNTKRLKQIPSGRHVTYRVL